VVRVTGRVVRETKTLDQAVADVTRKTQPATCHATPRRQTMTGYELYGLIVAALFTGSLLYFPWKIVKTIKE
jgi:hypothetical protein